ncbi:MAG: hypothetical protein F4Y07_07040 [Gemmatimonadetes bacterium]|nr:hypothetical protein [Gemmatimonadota bacterium]MYE16219.1 hypothetical protein [Gemmatimonadota bacterium]
MKQYRLPARPVRKRLAGTASSLARWLLAPALAVAACVDEEALVEIEPSRPTAITVTPSSATLSSLGETGTFRAQITDQNGVSFPGTVTWSSSDMGVFTVASGVVTAVANGSGTLTASYQSISGTASVTVRQAPAAVSVISGGSQQGMAGRQLAEAVVVRVDDAGGSAVEGVTVTFSAAEGHGAADPNMVVTDSEGLAATSWTLGGESGVQTLTASAADGVTAEINAGAGEIEPASDSASYSVTFNATWSATTHPTEFPPGPHFSPLIGAVHNDSVSFWAVGATASPGIEQMAETGGTGLLTREIRAEIPNNAISVVNGRGIGSPASTTISEVPVTLDHPLITLVTMIAPSPDWFVGVAGQSLQNEFGQWLDEVAVVLYPYDSGTDDGPSYRSANADSSPRQPIRSLRGVSPFSDEPIGTYTFTRIDAGGSR